MIGGCGAGWLDRKASKPGLKPQKTQKTQIRFGTRLADAAGTYYPTFTGTSVIVSLPKMSITFTATVYRPGLS